MVGEGLIDFIPGEDGRFMPRCGGAPFNVCLAMARLEAPTAFLSNVSTDMFGDQICAELAQDGVDLDMVKRVANPTTLAFVSFATGEPQYAFFYNDAADRSLTPATLPELPQDAAAMHLSMGAVTCEVEPVGAPPSPLPPPPQPWRSALTALVADSHLVRCTSTAHTYCNGLCLGCAYRRAGLLKAV